MSCPSTPYDILGIISFVQGTLTLTAAVLGAIWSFTYQVRVNKTSMESLKSKIKHLRETHPQTSLLESGKTQKLHGKLQEQEKNLDDMTPTDSTWATLLKQWLKQWFEQSKNASKLADISNKIETIILRFYLLEVRNEIVEEMKRQHESATRNNPISGNGEIS